MPTDVIAAPLTLPAPRIDAGIVKALATALLLIAVCAVSIAVVDISPDTVSAMETVAGP